MTIILYMVPEISTATEIFFVILNHFLPFYPPNSPKNGNIYKKMKTPGDIIILHKCTKTQDHRLHCSWDMVRDGCNCCFSFWAIFALLPPVTAEKIKTSKKKKKKNPRRYYHFKQVYQKSWLYPIPFLRYGVWQT